MKLAFLVEHLTCVQGCLEGAQTWESVLHPLLRVFSFDVMREYESLVREGVLIDGYPVRLGRGVKIQLDEELRRDVDQIIPRAP